MVSSKLLGEWGFSEETAEESRGQFIKTGFPMPLKRMRIVWETYNMSIEEAYFWTLNSVREQKFTSVYKTVDAFAASENSAFFGVAQVRLGAQQDRVSQNLATIGKMVKELFQLVRELRIIDERMEYYKGTKSEDKHKRETAEVTLKGIFVDMVQGGAKNPASVFGMAREVGFIALPDLFFATNPKNADDVGKVIETERGQFNVSVKEALKRHLLQYMVWKEKTESEMNTRRTFTLKYLKQHYDVIKMYMAWVKPYIKHIKKLTLDEEKMLTPDLISAFEGSLVEIEFLATPYSTALSPAKEKPDKDKKSNPEAPVAVVVCSFNYRTRPSMSFQQEGYQRGPVHVGRLDMQYRAYAWTPTQIKNYLAMKNNEDLELLGSISDSVKIAMEALGKELENYLKEAEGTKEEKKKEETPPAPGFFERLKLDFFGPTVESKKSAEKKAKATELQLAAAKSSAKSSAKGCAFNTYKFFKKAHGMVMW